MQNLQSLCDWFHDYVQTFYCQDEFVMSGIRLKEAHSIRVVNYTKELTADLGMTDQHRTLAETIGLFHDLLRFHQWSTYHTFYDSKDFDHGDAAAAELEKADILQSFTQDERDIIVFAVRYHNKLAVPEASPEKLLFANIIRDVDKIDILRSLPPVNAAHNYSPKLVEQLYKGERLSYEDVKDLADKRLIRLSWLYDMNFDWTLAELVRGGDVEKLLESLPLTAPFNEIRSAICEYTAKRTAARLAQVGDA